MHQPSTILDHPIVSSRYFFPRHETFPNPYWIDAADGSKLACSYHVVNPTATTVVYFHGNGEVVADYLPGLPDWLTQARLLPVMQRSSDVILSLVPTRTHFPQAVTSIGEGRASKHPGSAAATPARKTYRRGQPTWIGPSFTVASMNGVSIERVSPVQTT